MSIRKSRDFSYLGNLQEAWYAHDQADIEELKKILGSFNGLGNSMGHAMPLLFILDYTNAQYLLLTDAIMAISGYHPKEFIESKMDKLLDVFHKDDFKVFNKQLFVRNTSFLESTPIDEHASYLFSYNFRFVKCDGNYANILQRSTYITSRETGLPLYSIGVITDISDFKHDDVIVHTIEKKGESWKRQTIEKNYYYPTEDFAQLSAREVEVLKHTADGLSAKQVAHKLHISMNTVVNHRQNIFKKTNTKNVAELIAVCIKRRII